MGQLQNLKGVFFGWSLCSSPEREDIAGGVRNPRLISSQFSRRIGDSGRPHAVPQATSTASCEALLKHICSSFSCKGAAIDVVWTWVSMLCDRCKFSDCALLRLALLENVRRISCSALYFRFHCLVFLNRCIQRESSRNHFACKGTYAKQYSAPAHLTCPPVLIHVVVVSKFECSGSSILRSSKQPFCALECILL